MRLIDADKLLEGIAELKQSPWFNNKYGYADRKEAVESIEYLCIKKEPTIDAVEVIRCKDCRWNSECRMLDDDNGFCSDAERREIDGTEDIPMEYWENGGI